MRDAGFQEAIISPKGVRDAFCSSKTKNVGLFLRAMAARTESPSVKTACVSVPRIQSFGCNFADNGSANS